METLNYVKDVVETIRFRHRRMKDVSSDIEMCYKNNENVRIIYDTDSEENKDTVSKIWRVSEDSILLTNLKMIPIIAIKKVEMVA